MAEGDTMATWLDHILGYGDVEYVRPYHKPCHHFEGPRNCPIRGLTQYEKDENYYIWMTRARDVMDLYDDQKIYDLVMGDALLRRLLQWLQERNFREMFEVICSTPVLGQVENMEPEIPLVQMAIKRWAALWRWRAAELLQQRTGWDFRCP